MENNGYHLDLFTDSMLRYFNEVLIHKNYVSTSFRKYSLKNGEDAEFSFQIKPSVSTNDCDEDFLARGLDSAFFTEEDFDKLLNCSQLWSLHLADVSINGSRITFKLDQPQALSRVLKSILNEQTKYGVNFSISQAVRVSVIDGPTEDLTQHRLRLIKRTVDNIFSAVRIRNPQDFTEICLTNKTGKNSMTNVICGVVINAKKGTKEVDLTPEDYYNIQLEEARVMSKHKYWGSQDEALLRDLAEASVTMSFLEVNPRHTITLKTESVLGGSASKGASFVLYNSARLAAIRRKFEKQCEEGVHPDLPELEEVDFSLLREPEEWRIFFNFLLEYPTMIRRICEEASAGVVITHHICRFLSNLSSLFSVYYRRVRVLLEPRKHLIPLIFARIYLLRATEQIMHNALSLLNIKIIEEM